MKKALLAGATGLIGKQFLSLLIQHNQYANVTCLVREIPEDTHPKVYYRVVDFDVLDALDPSLVADDVFCCLGTTMKKAGTKKAFRKVDYEYPLALAKRTYARGSQRYFLVSSLGASTSSWSFYNQVKGETETDIRTIEFPSFHVFRPSILLGERLEQRPFEELFKKMFSFLSPAIPLKYRPIHAAKVAASMMTIAQREEKGNFIYESDVMQQLGDSL